MTNLKDIAIRQVQNYLQGIKTIHEIKADIDNIPEFKDIPDTVELPNELLRQVNLGVYNCKELFDIPNFSATRQGLIHLLESYLNGQITATELNDWAENQICWEIGKGQDDILVDGIVGEFGMCEEYTIKNLTPDVINRFILLLKTKKADIVENALLLLCYNDRRNALSYLLTEYKKGENENLLKFLLDNFQTDIDGFMFKDIFANSSADKSENLKLLDKLYE